jgi:DNA polymerase-3 subunit epsilon
MRLLVIDTETGGTDAQTNSILSLAAVVWDNARTSVEFDVAIVEPILSVTPKAMEINRIDLAEHAKHGVPPAVAVELFNTFLLENFPTEIMSHAKVVLSGHNIGFDVAFLKRLYVLGGGNFDEMFSHRLLDTAGIVRFLSLAGLTPLASAGSSEAFSHFGIVVPDCDRHTALGDARATADLLTKLVGVGRTLDAKHFAA